MSYPATPGGVVASTSTSPVRTLGPTRSFAAKTLAASLALVTTLACADRSITTVIPLDGDGPSLEHATLRAVSGGDQIGEAGAVLEGPLVVEVYDSAGAPFVGAPVQWSLSAGSAENGTGTPTNVVRSTTDESGRATLAWQLGTTAGTQEGQVEIVLPETASSSPALRRRRIWAFLARVRPARAEVVSVTPAGFSVVSGQSVQLGARVADRYGNVIDTATVEWATENPQVAVVDSDGVVQAVGDGDTRITATHKRIEGVASVQASAPAPANQAPLSWIVIPDTAVTIEVGEAVDVVGGSSDPDGTVEAHSWSFGDGATSTVADPGPHTFTEAGVYLVTYQVTDDDGALSGVASVQVTVTAPTPPANQPPSAWIVSPDSALSIEVGGAVDVQGGATDSDGSIAAHAWSFGDGSGSTLADPAPHVYETPGSYLITYQVTDDDGATSSVVSVQVTVDAVVPPTNQAPEAWISSPGSAIAVEFGTPVDVLGGSSDADGTVTGHQWSFGDGNGSNAADPAPHTYAEAGSYLVTYQVTDDDGATSPVASVQVTVEAPANEAPLAWIASPESDITVEFGTAVDVLGGSSDSDGTVTTHSWAFGDGNVADVPDPSPHVYEEAGTYLVTYQVTDDDGATSAVASVQVTVEGAPNQAPTAWIAAPVSDITVEFGTPVDVLGGSSDADGTVSGHSWSFGDGSTASVPDPAPHVYGSAGSYTVTYQVTDDDGATSDIVSVEVTVEAPVNQAPVAWIVSPSSDISIELGTPIDVLGGSSDSDGSITAHNWSFGDGNGAAVADPATHVYAQEGTYLVTYQVTDDDGATSSTASVEVTVTTPPPPPPPPPPSDRVVLFHSDWSTATGTGHDAIFDTDKAKPWTDGWFDSNSTVVIADGDSLDFPTQNVLANRLSRSMGGGQVKILERDDYFDPPEVGESIYFRFYRRIALPNSHTGDQTTHGFHDDDKCCSDMNLSLTLSTTTSGTYGMELGTGWATNDSIAYWSTPNSALQKHETYRMEFRIHRESVDGFQLEARVYDSADRLVLSNEDFTATGWGARGHYSLADGKRLFFNSDRGVNALLDLRLGLNGIGGVSGTYPHGYWGAFAVCANDWCGPYRDGM